MQTSVAERVKNSVETGAGAGAIGVLTGYLGTPYVPGTPIPLGLAAYAIAQAVCLLAPVGSLGDDIARVGDGALAGSLAVIGTGWGSKLRAESGKPVGPIIAGAPAYSPTYPGAFGPATAHYPPPAMPVNAPVYAPGEAPAGAESALSDAEMTSLIREQARRTRR